MPFTGVTLTDLNNFMKDYPSGRIVPNEIYDQPLLEALRPNLNTEQFIGDDVEVLIQDSMPYTGAIHYEDADIVLPDDMSFVKMLIPLRELMVNAGVTKQSLDRATGGMASWGRVVDRVLREQKRDWRWLLELGLIGHGTGGLARVVSATNDGSTTTITCDNTYTDFGWENTKLLKVGMDIEIYSSAGAQRTGAASVTHWRVTGVTPGTRSTSTWAATTGTFTVADDGTLQAALADNDVVYLYRSKSSALTGPNPMGLTGIVQGSGDGRSGTASITTFQNLTRSSYSALKGRVYQATDFGLSSESPADGTPTLWSLSDISDCFMDVETGTGMGKVNLILTSHKIAQAIHRLNRSETNMTIQVPSTGQLNQAAIGSQYAGSLLAPDGRVIPVRVAWTLPDYVLYGLTTDDIRWHVKGAFDFLRLSGDVWDKSYADRKTNFEAPFGGYMQISADRCDNCFCIEDLRYDVG